MYYIQTLIQNGILYHSLVNLQWEWYFEMANNALQKNDLIKKITILTHKKISKFSNVSSELKIIQLLRTYLS